MNPPSEKSGSNPKPVPASSSNETRPALFGVDPAPELFTRELARLSLSNGRKKGPPPRVGVRKRAYLLAWFVIAVFLIAAHGPLFETPFYWDEAGQFVPASLDILHEGKWIPTSTLPNVHPPLVMGYLAAVWKVAGYSWTVTRVAMLAIAAFGVLFAFLLSIDLSRGSPGAPAIVTPVLLCISPLFFAQSMLAQLDMPAMAATCLALLLFLQNRFRDSAITCLVLVLIKETGILVPMVFAGWLFAEKRYREAAWFAMPFVALAGWLGVLKIETGHWLGSASFTDYNVFYPLHPARLAFAILRRLYYLFVGSGHIFGTLTLLVAWRTMPLLKSRPWQIAGSLVAAQVLLVSVLGGAVLERYLLPVLPIVYAAFAVSLRALLGTPRKLALGALMASLVAANFVNPPYPFPFENNLAFVSFAQLEAEAANAAYFVPGVIATTFPMTDALRKPELGFVEKARQVMEMKDFRAASVAQLSAHRPDVMLVYNTEWDPFNILTSGPFLWLMQGTYGFEPQLSADRIADILSMRVARTWERRGLKMSLLVRGKDRGKDRGNLSLLR